MLEFTQDFLKKTNLKFLPGKTKVNLVVMKYGTLIISDTRFALKFPLGPLGDQDYVFYSLIDNAPKLSDLKKGFTLKEENNVVILSANNKEFYGIPFGRTNKLFEMLKPNPKYSYCVNLEKLKKVLEDSKDNTYFAFDKTKFISMNSLGKNRKEHPNIIEEFTDFNCSTDTEELDIGIRKEFLDYIVKTGCNIIDLRPDNIFQAKMDLFAGFKF